MTPRHLSPAFTLLETIIAMTLMSLLMAVVWTMFSMYTKLEAKGRQVVDEATLARAIDRQLRSDLLHVVAIDPFSDNESDIPSSGDSTAESNQLEKLQRSSDTIRGYFYGTANEMHFVVSTGGSDGERSRELRVISYQPRLGTLPNPDEATSSTQPEFEDVSELDSTRGIESDRQRMSDGMDRNDRSWSSYWENGRVDESNGPLLSTNRPIALDQDDLIKIGSAALDDDEDKQNFSVREDQVDEIPELKRIRIRYFDGRGWLETWDSDSAGRLPVALEIGFDLETKAKADSANQSLAEFDTASSDRLSVGNAEIADTPFTSQYRLTIAIAAAGQPAAPDGGTASASSQSARDASEVSGALP